MTRALELAKRAQALGEVPVGAVLVCEDRILGEGFNQPISRCDASAHAEIMALREAGKAQQNYRFPDTTLYVTLEPCAMCAGAIVHARVARLVFAAREPKAGVAVSQQHFFMQPYLNHRVMLEEGLLAEESSALLSGFFQQRRAARKRARQAHANAPAPDA